MAEDTTTMLLIKIAFRADPNPTSDELDLIRPGLLDKDGDPKRSPNPWILYRAHEHARQKMVGGDVSGQSKNISLLWKALSEQGQSVWYECAYRVLAIHRTLFPLYHYQPTRKSISPHATQPPSQEILPHASPSTNTAPGRNKRKRKTQRVAPYPPPQRTPTHPPVSSPHPAPFVPPNTVHRRLTGEEECFKDLDMVAMAFPNMSLNQVPSLFGSEPLSAHHTSQQFHQTTFVPSSTPFASAPSGFWPGNQYRPVPSHVDAGPPMFGNWGVSTSNLGQAPLPPANDFSQSSWPYGVGSSSLSSHGFEGQQQFYSM